MTPTYDIRAQSIPSVNLSELRMGECNRFSLNSAVLAQVSAPEAQAPMAMILTVGRPPARLHRNQMGMLNAFTVLVQVVDVAGRRHGALMATLFKGVPDRDRGIQYWDLVFNHFDQGVQSLLSTDQQLELAGDVANVVNRMVSTEDSFSLSTSFTSHLYGSGPSQIDEATKVIVDSWGCTSINDDGGLFAIPEATLSKQLSHPDIVQVA